MFYAINLRRAVKWLKPVFVLLLLGAGMCYVFNIRYPLEYLDEIYAYADKYGLEPELVCGIIHTESRFRRDAVSPKGASGLMQIAKITGDWAAQEIGIAGYSYDNILDPGINIEIGCWYISRLIQQYGGNVDTALAAYNAGSGNVSKWLSDSAHSTDGVNLYDIPFGETARYVERVNTSRRIYEVMIKMRKKR